ncbi:unnamed protein product [Oikopleura dioica]|uniref:Carbohydrate sulfotransferase n=1 Tax=Oikopleura dioica TaxID=34765 RepID=E4X329_OIKDI|nr:unnamed protein product [Oikopleura dioica]
MTNEQLLPALLGVIFFLVAFFYIGDLENILGYETLALQSPATAKKKSFLEDPLGTSETNEHLDLFDWEKIYESRKNLTRDTCQALPNDHQDNTHIIEKVKAQILGPFSLRFVVDEKHKILYCELPKTGCTNWKKTLLKLIQPDTFGKMKWENIRSPHGKKGPNGYSYLNEYPLEKQLEYLDTFYKFSFVRHPLERLLSAYRDKVEKYLKKAPEFNDENWRRGKFHSFVRDLIENGLPRQPGQRRRHWSSFMYLCDFCSVGYDFIGKMDTLNTDVNYVLNDMNVSELTEYPTGYSTKSYNSLLVYYKGMGRETLEQLYLLYKTDFDAFGYTIPEKFYEYV